MMRNRQELQASIDKYELERSALYEQRQAIDDKIKAINSDINRLKNRLKSQNRSNDLPAELPPIRTPAQQKQKDFLTHQLIYFTGKQSDRKQKYKPLVAHVRKLQGSLGNLEGKNGYESVVQLVDELGRDLSELRKATDEAFLGIQNKFFSE